jgi:hypothetical protein
MGKSGNNLLQDSWHRGLYIGKYPLPWGGFQPMSFRGEKYEKGKRKKVANVKKRKKFYERKKGKEKERKLKVEG